MKLFLRKVKPKEHWHIGSPPCADTYQSLTRIIDTDPKDFFTFLLDEVKELSCNAYNNLLTSAQENAVKDYKSKLLEHKIFTEFYAVDIVLEHLQGTIKLHLGNSMPVRYAALSGITNHDIEVFSNRGTSGIDGSLSTAVGHAMADQEHIHVLIIGDISFFYDRNGLWNDLLPDNMRIVLLNNGGGGIFSMIDGPSNQKGVIDYMNTPHSRNAKLTAQEFNLSYQTADSADSLKAALNSFFEKHEKSGILEVFVEIKQNALFLKKLKKG